MITCSRIFDFDAAHRVKEHESKCKHLHGHRFRVEVTFISKNGLDSLGRVIDFGSLKEILGGWIDEHFDHNTILFEEDRELGQQIENFTGQKVYYLPYNPTAENIAYYLLHEVCSKMFDGDVKCIKIKMYETPQCYTEVIL